MAKSIYDIVEAGTAEINHNGDNCFVVLPKWWMDVTKSCLNDNDTDLSTTLAELPIETHRAWIQAACAKTLIELRAVARPADFPAKEGGGKRELNTPDGNGLLPQDRVDAYELKPYKRPGTAKVVTEESVNADFAKLSDEAKIRLIEKMSAQLGV